MDYSSPPRSYGVTLARELKPDSGKFAQQFTLKITS